MIDAQQTIGTTPFTRTRLQMATPSKKSSGWGSFLQQAIDGVESRLDNILVGDGPLEPSAATTKAPVKPDAGDEIL